MPPAVQPARSTVQRAHARGRLPADKYFLLSQSGRKGRNVWRRGGGGNGGRRRPVVSRLACFTDFVRDGKTGRVRPYAPDAAAKLRRPSSACSATPAGARTGRRRAAGRAATTLPPMPRPPGRLRTVDRPRPHPPNRDRRGSLSRQNCTTPYSEGGGAAPLDWLMVQSTLFRQPAPFHGFSRLAAALLRRRHSGPVVIFPTARIMFPPVALAPRSMVGPHVNLYNLAPSGSSTARTSSQHCTCAPGTHDSPRWSMRSSRAAIAIGRNAWLGADVFVGPGVTVRRTLRGRRARRRGPRPARPQDLRRIAVPSVKDRPEPLRRPRDGQDKTSGRVRGSVVLFRHEAVP